TSAFDAAMAKVIAGAPRATQPAEPVAQTVGEDVQATISPAVTTSNAAPQLPTAVSVARSQPPADPSKEAAASLTPGATGLTPDALHTLLEMPSSPAQRDDGMAGGCRDSDCQPAEVPVVAVRSSDRGQRRARSVRGSTGEPRGSLAMP